MNCLWRSSELLTQIQQLDWMLWLQKGMQRAKLHTSLKLFLVEQKSQARFGKLYCLWVASLCSQFSKKSTSINKRANSAFTQKPTRKNQTPQKMGQRPASHSPGKGCAFCTRSPGCRQPKPPSALKARPSTTNPILDNKLDKFYHAAIIPI